MQSKLPEPGQGTQYFAPTLQSRGYIVRQSPVSNGEADYQAPQYPQFLSPQMQFNSSFPTNGGQHSAYWPNKSYQTSSCNQNYTKPAIQPSFDLQQCMPVNQQGLFNNVPQAQWNNPQQWTCDQSFYGSQFSANYNPPQSLNASCMYNELPQQIASISAVNPGYRFAADQSVRSVEVLTKTTSPYVLKGKRKRTRTAFTTQQVEILEDTFNSSQYINKIQRQKITRRLGLSEQAVKVWFQNRRMKGKREVQELYEESERSSSESSGASSILDDIAAQIQTPSVDGFVTVSDEALNKLFDIVNQHIPDSIMFDLLNTQVESTISAETTGCYKEIDLSPASTEQANHDSIRNDLISEDLIPCETEVTVTDSAEMVQITVPIYEPISPPDVVNETVETWVPTENTDLQSIFDTHFC